MAEKDTKRTKTEKTENKKTPSQKQGSNDLVLDLQAKRERLANLKLDHKLGKLKNPNEIKKIRKEIARLETKLNLQKFIS